MPYDEDDFKENFENQKRWWNSLLNEMGGVEPNSKVDFLFYKNGEDVIYDWKNQTVEEVGNDPVTLNFLYQQVMEGQGGKDSSPVYWQRKNDMGAVELQVKFSGPVNWPSGQEFKERYKKAQAFYEELTELIKSDDPNVEIKNPNFYRRLMVANNENPPKMTPLFPEGKAPFDADLAVDVEKGISELMDKMKKGNIFIQKPERNIYTNIQLHDDSPQIGQTIADKNEWNKIREPIKKAKPPHGSVGMFFYKMFHSINKKWFSKEIKEQSDFYENQKKRLTEAEEKFEKELNGKVMEENVVKEKVEKTITAKEREHDKKREIVEQSKKDLQKVKQIYRNLDSMSRKQSIKLEDKKDLKSMIFDSVLEKGTPEKKQLDETPETEDMLMWGVVSGVLGQDPAKCGGQEKFNQLMDGLLDNKNLTKDPNLKDAVNSGLNAYRDANKEFTAPDRERVKPGEVAYNPEPYMKLMANTLRNLSKYASNETPLSTKHVMAGRLCSEMLKYVNEMPQTLKDTFTSQLTQEEMVAVHGTVALGEVVAHGIEARVNLIDGYESKMRRLPYIEDKGKAKEEFDQLAQKMKSDIDNYVAMCALEQGVIENKKQCENTIMQSSSSPISVLLGSPGFGTKELQSYVGRCNTMKQFLSAHVGNVENGMEALGKAWHTGRTIAVDENQSCILGKKVMGECYRSIAHEFKVRGMSVPYQSAFVPKNEQNSNCKEVSVYKNNSNQPSANKKDRPRLMS